MRKYLVWGPAVWFSLFYLLIIIGYGFDMVRPSAYGTIVLSCTAALLFHKNKWYGVVPGVIIGLHRLHSYYSQTINFVDTRPFIFALIDYYIIMAVYIKKTPAPK